jgi:hypothetical protein
LLSSAARELAGLKDPTGSVVVVGVAFFMPVLRGLHPVQVLRAHCATSNPEKLPSRTHSSCQLSELPSADHSFRKIILSFMEGWFISPVKTVIYWWNYHEFT